MKTFLFAVVLSFTASVASAEDVLPVPSHVAITIESDRQEYFLGENLLLHYSIENAGSKSVFPEFGGDYRGCGRATRFQVRAVDAAGNEAVDPYNDNNMGGLCGREEIKPKSKYYVSLRLSHYRQIDRPGTYTITVKHDLGWKETPATPIPVAELKLTFKKPTPAEAKELLAAMLNAADEKHDDDYRHERKTKPYPNLNGLRDPVYLPELIALLPSKSTHVLDGIASIATPTATEALIRAANDDDRTFALHAGRHLLRRVPLPEPKDDFEALAREVGKMMSWENQEVLDKFIADSWQRRHAADVRRVARKMLTVADPEMLDCANKLLERVEPAPMTR